MENIVNAAAAPQPDAGVPGWDAQAYASMRDEIEYWKRRAEESDEALERIRKDLAPTHMGEPVIPQPDIAPDAISDRGGVSDAEREPDWVAGAKSAHEFFYPGQYAGGEYVGPEKQAPGADEREAVAEIDALAAPAPPAPAKAEVSSRAQLGAVPDGCALIPLTERMPDPDKHPRVVVYTEGTDFAGEQFFDVQAESLNECFYEYPADQPEVCRYATHWIGTDVLAARAAQPAPSQGEDASHV